MKTAVILLSLAALGLATPRPDFGLSVEARQEPCLYDIFCRSPPPGEDVDPDTPRCCAVVGGTLHETGTVCSSPPNPVHVGMGAEFSSI